MLSKLQVYDPRLPPLPMQNPYLNLFWTSTLFPFLKIFTVDFTTNLVLNIDRQIVCISLNKLYLILENSISKVKIIVKNVLIEVLKGDILKTKYGEIYQDNKPFYMRFCHLFQFFWHACVTFIPIVLFFIYFIFYGERTDGYNESCNVVERGKKTLCRQSNFEK